MRTPAARLRRAGGSGGEQKRKRAGRARPAFVSVLLPILSRRRRRQACAFQLGVLGVLGVRSSGLVLCVRAALEFRHHQPPVVAQLLPETDFRRVVAGDRQGFDRLEELDPFARFA